MSFVLRDYQQEAVNAFFEFVKRGGRYGCISVPTGGGKSLILSDICMQLISKWSHTKVIVATHKYELIKQNKKEFQDYYPGVKCGVYSAGLNERNVSARVIFAGIQSCTKHAYDFGRVDLLIIDEAHLVSPEDGTQYAQFIANLKTANPNIVILGLSATCFRLDNGFIYDCEGALFEELIYEIEIGKLIEDGWLCPIISKGMIEEIDLSNVKKTAGEYNKKDLELEADKDKLIKSAVDELVKYGKDRNSWLIFASGISHATHICEEIHSRGINCKVVTSKTDKKERAQILEDFKHRKLRAVVNVDILTTGFNAKNTDLICMMMSTTSTGKYIQICGRGTRTAPGKNDCLLLDMGHNVETHGFLDDVSVNIHKKGNGNGEAPCRKCPVCNNIVPASTRFCPECFHEFPSSAPHEAHAYDGAVLSKDETPKLYHVDAMGAYRHKKADKPDSIRLEFHVLERNEPFNHYLTLDHGGFAAKKALQYVQAAGGCATTVDDALKEYYAWRDPVKIWVKKNGKFRNIVQFEFPDDTAQQVTL